MIMKTLYESILDDIDAQLERGESDVKNEFYNLDTLPTPKDFKVAPFNKNWHEATWYCPAVIDRYRSKYPNLIPTGADSISIVIDKSFKSVCDVKLYSSIGKGNRGVTTQKKGIYGWSDGYVGANLRKYKQMAIDVLNKLANNPDKMDKMMEYANGYTKAMFSDHLEGEEFHKTAARWKMKQFSDL